MARFSIGRVEIQPRRSRPSAWSFAGNLLRGTEHTYIVKDRNLVSRNRWEFIVRVPDDANERIEVRPVRTPNDKAFAGLDRRSITFAPASARRYVGSRYCEVSLADYGGRRSRRVVHISEKGDLPDWFKGFSARFSGKGTVRPSSGKDAAFLVVVVRPEDHESMIRLFLASKAWVLKSQFSLDG